MLLVATSGANRLAIAVPLVVTTLLLLAIAAIAGATARCYWRLWPKARVQPLEWGVS